MSGNINIERYLSLNDVHKYIWEKGIQLPLPMRYDLLNIVEKSGINDLQNFYLRFNQNGTELARANLYMVNTDFASMDTKMPKDVRNVIQRWYPGFMNFKVLECGFFTMIGEGIVHNGNASPGAILSQLAKEMELIANEENAEIQLIRDIPFEKYNQYRDVLKLFGYYPLLGFPNTEIRIRWNSIDEYFDDLKSDTRHKLRKSLRLKEKYDIDYEFTNKYSDFTPIFAKLWADVNTRADNYNREFLSEGFFSIVEAEIPDKNEALIFTHNGNIIAFMLNYYDSNNYMVYDWGIDYSFPHYKNANLFRATNVLCLQRAIERGINNIKLGVTNYYPKMIMGARIQPLIYFIKHTKTPKYSRVIAKLLSDNIKQPDPCSHRPYKNIENNQVDIDAIKLQIKKDQNDLYESDIYHKISNYYRVDVTRLAGIYNLYPEFKSSQKSCAKIKNNKEVILLGTNSYLGASTHPDVIRAAKEAIDIYGTGCSGSPLLNGTLDIHNLLEREIADFMNREAVVLCSTGYQTNLAGLSTLCEPGDLIIMDERNHRSLFDGARLSEADYVVYRHNDMSRLHRILSRTLNRRKIIVIDSVFSMEGALSDLNTICELAKKYNARTYVDEAHGVGVFGKNGRGVCELMGVEDEVDLIMCTFSKSFASIGGFIAGDNETIDYIKHRASPHLFSAGLPPGNELLASAAYKKFMENGVYVNPTAPPAVPEEESGLRTSYIATHEWDDLQIALKVFEKFSKDLCKFSISGW